MTTPAEKVTKLIIDRKKWARGRGGSELLQEDSTMCCLGFYAKALGYTDDDIRWRSTPSETIARHPTKRNLFPAWLLSEKSYTGNSEAGCLLMKYNDAPNYEVPSEAVREANIARIFKEVGGVDVEFVG